MRHLKTSMWLFGSLSCLACAGESDKPNVVGLPGREPVETVPCSDENECTDEEICADALCSSIWGRYEVRFVSIAIPQTKQNLDADGGAPDPMCDLRASEQPALGGTDTVMDTYETVLSGGGYADMGPETMLTVRCWDSDDENPIVIGEFCWGKDGECGPIPSKVLKDGSNRVGLENGAFSGVEVELSFSMLTQ